jgi:uncharacterized membrane protein YbhN (UPF0104 family)
MPDEQPAAPPAPPAPPKRSSPARTLLPWLVAGVTLWWLFRQVSFTDLKNQLARASLAGLLATVVVYVLAALVVDSFATWITYRRAVPDKRVPFTGLLQIRGASYLLALIHYGIGQGAIAYLVHKRFGVNLARSAGAVMLTAGVNVILVALCALLGVAIGGAPASPALRLIVLAIAIAFPVYLVVIALRPPILEKRALLRPLFEAGVVGHLVVTAARLPHLAVLVAGHLAAMRLFGITPSLGDGLALLPVVFVIGQLPISPSGLGTAQAAAVTLFAQFAPGIRETDRQAAVLAYSLSLQFLGLFAQAAVGLVCLRSATRTDTIKSGEGA